MLATPIPIPTFSLKGEERLECPQCLLLLVSLPFKGRVGEGMGETAMNFQLPDSRFNFQQE